MLKLLRENFILEDFALIENTFDIDTYLVGMRFDVCLCCRFSVALVNYVDVKTLGVSVVYAASAQSLKRIDPSVDEIQKFVFVCFN